MKNPFRKKNYKVKTFWADYPQFLILIWENRMNRRFEKWEVHDEIRLVFHWRKFESRFRLKLRVYDDKFN